MARFRPELAHEDVARLDLGTLSASFNRHVALVHVPRRAVLSKAEFTQLALRQPRSYQPILRPLPIGRDGPEARPAFAAPFRMRFGQVFMPTEYLPETCGDRTPAPGALGRELRLDLSGNAASDCISDLLCRESRWIHNEVESSFNVCAEGSLAFKLPSQPMR